MVRLFDFFAKMRLVRFYTPFFKRSPGYLDSVDTVRNELLVKDTLNNSDRLRILTLSDFGRRVRL